MLLVRIEFDGVELEGLEWSPNYNSDGNIESYEWVGYDQDERNWMGIPYVMKLKPKDNTIGNAAVKHKDGTVTLYSTTSSFQPKLKTVNIKINNSNYEHAASILNLEVAVLKAFAKKEAPRGAFQGDNGEHATVLFERHYMFRYLSGSNTDIENLRSSYSGSIEFDRIVNRKAGGYGKYKEQPLKIDLAKSMNPDYAIMSASWGSFQVMGSYYKWLYETTSEFEVAMNNSESEQFNYFLEYLKNVKGLIKALQDKDFQKAAKLYNGPDAPESYGNDIENFYNNIIKNEN